MPDPNRDPYQNWNRQQVLLSQKVRKGRDGPHFLSDFNRVAFWYHHPPPRTHNGLQGQSECDSMHMIPFCGQRFFFAYCIANFELGLCDIPLFFSLSANPAGYLEAFLQRLVGLGVAGHYGNNSRATFLIKQLLFWGFLWYTALTRGDGMSNFDKSEYWFESAEYDLQTARAMLETRRLLYVGFMCHQTIEKALKGIFVSRKPEEELPYIHKLMRLANLSEISSEMSE